MSESPAWAGDSSGLGHEPIASSNWVDLFCENSKELKRLLAERGLHADHVTVWRWVQRYAPQMERRLRKWLKATNDSWRVDETYVRVKAGG